MKTLRTTALLAMLILALFAMGCTAQDQPAEDAAPAPANTVTETPVLKLGAIPDQNQAKLNRRFTELATYIGQETGYQVEYVETVDYAALVTAFERGEVQLAWFGGLTGVQARNLVEDAEAIAQRPRDEQFHSVFVADKGLGLSSLEDIKGHRLTFGSENSTSGHLMPRHFMMEAGLDLDADLDGQVNYSGSHDKTWKLVESGAFQVGALNEAVWERAVAEGSVDLDKIDVFYTTPAYYDYNWTVGNLGDFDAEAKGKIQDALLSFGEAKPEIMELFSDDRFIATTNENYNAILEVAKALGIIQ